MNFGKIFDRRAEKHLKEGKGRIEKEERECVTSEGL